MEISDSRTPQVAQTLDRGLRILEAVARSGEPVSVAEAAQLVGIDRTVAHRLVSTLAVRGYLHREQTGYRLGPTCLALASAISDLRSLARPYLEDLAQATGETVHLVVLSGREVVFIDGIESAKALRVSTRVGRLLPAHATSVGKAWLATLPSDQLEALYGHAELAEVTGQTITSAQQLNDELDRVHRRGYAVSKGESEDGVGSVGVAVVARSGEARAAISVALPLNRWSEDVERDAAAALHATARALGERL
jgi:DNA-binding IclR family transcriptional regulator